jgi:hypothetical protein
MGMFDKIKKVAKKIVKGVKKVFKKVVDTVVKILNSKIGKVIMLAATVVTAGAALYGAYAGMTGALSTAQAGSFATKFTTGFKGALAGLKTGAGMGQKALGQVAKLNMGGAANTLKGVGAAANTAGQAVNGLAAATKSANAIASAAGEAVPGAAPGAPAAAGKGTVGGLLPEGAGSAVPGQSWQPIQGAANPASGVVDLANSTGATVQGAVQGAQTAGQSMQEGLLAQLIQSQNASARNQLIGNVLSQGAQAYGNYNTAQAQADAEEEAVRRGWGRDSSFSPYSYV